MTYKVLGPFGDHSSQPSMADGLLSKIGSKDFAEAEERKLERGGVVDVRSERNTVEGREKDWMSVHDER